MQRTGLSDVLRYLNFYGRGAKGQIISCWKIFGEKLWLKTLKALPHKMKKKLLQKCNNRDCHQKEMFDIKSIFWGRARGIRERETKSCPLLSCCSPPQEERKGVAGNSIISRRSVNFVYFDTDSCIFEIWGLKILKLLQNRSLVKCLIWNCDRSQLKRSASVNFMSNLAKQG